MKRKVCKILILFIEHWTLWTHSLGHNWVFNSDLFSASAGWSTATATSTATTTTTTTASTTTTTATHGYRYCWIRNMWFWLCASTTTAATTAAARATARCKWNEKNLLHFDKLQSLIHNIFGYITKSLIYFCMICILLSFMMKPKIPKRSHSILTNEFYQIFCLESGFFPLSKERRRKKTMPQLLDWISM